MICKKSIAVLVLAMICTGCVGFFANFQEQPSTTTIYTPIGNLDALMSANSGEVTTSEVYNSPYNVTAWEGDATIQLTNSANPYIITPSESGRDESHGVYDFNQHGATLKYSGSALSNTRAFPTTVANVGLDVNNDYLTDNSGRYGPVVGGYGNRIGFAGSGGGAHYSWYNLNYYLNESRVVSYNNNVAMYFVGASEIVSGNIVDGTRLYISADVGIKLCKDFSFNRTVTRIDSVDYDYNFNVVVNANLIEYDYLQYNYAEHKWYVYKDGLRGVSSDNFYFIIQTDNDSIHTINWTLSVPRFTPATYGDPTKFVRITGDSEWSNYAINDSFINTEVSLLWQGEGELTINNEDGLKLIIEVIDGKYMVKTSPSTYTVIGKWQNPSIPSDEWSADTYKALYITLSAGHTVATIKGVLAFENTRSFTLADVVYEAGFYNNPIQNGDSIPNITSLLISSSDVNVYISETWILTDPTGILWANPLLNINDYFTEYSSSMRVLIEGVVAYGDKFTVNGVSYPVENGQFSITVNVGTPSSPNFKVYSFTVKGLAIDFKETEGVVHTYLTQTEGKSYTLDLGPTVSYAVGGEGAWYFSSIASRISEIPDTIMVWHPGWDMSWNATLLLFVGIVIGFCCVLLLVFRDEISIYDIIILVLTILICASMMVVE